MKALEFDITNMNDIELKGEIEQLPYMLTKEQEAELLTSLEESYQEENLVSIDEAKKFHARWL